MGNVVKIVFLLIAGGCFWAIHRATFVTEQMTVDQFMNLVYAGMATVVIIIGMYLVYWTKKNSRQ
jgi:hypothetical protein